MAFLSLPPPDTRCYILKNATLPMVTVRGFEGPANEGLALADITIRDGLVESIQQVGNAPVALPSVDLKQGMVWPCFTDMHTHLDKGHIWGRRPNPDGSFLGALEAVHADSAVNWTADDLKKRMNFSLRSAFAHGTQLIRTHLDCFPGQHRITFDVFADIKEQWKDRIALQPVALFGFDMLADAAFFADMVKMVRDANGLLGGFPLMTENLQDQLDQLFRAASDNGLDLDLHVDESDDPAARSLKMMADTALKFRFEGRMTAGHCCSLARQDAETVKATLGAVAEAGMSVVSLPMCNMYLQDRYAGRTPRWRGTTLFQELAAAGIETAVSSDNTRDPFYAYGDLDCVEVFREAVRILHLDHPLTEAARIVTSTPASILRQPERGTIAPGQPADLVLFSARRWSEFLSRPQTDRIVLRKGLAIETTLPDYSELDDVTGA